MYFSFQQKNPTQFLRLLALINHSSCLYPDAPTGGVLYSPHTLISLLHQHHATSHPQPDSLQSYHAILAWTPYPLPLPLPACSFILTMLSPFPIPSMQVALRGRRWAKRPNCSTLLERSWRSSRLWWVQSVCRVLCFCLKRWRYCCALSICQHCSNFILEMELKAVVAAALVIVTVVVAAKFPNKVAAPLGEQCHSVS